jgi:N-6 DNA Methylase/EcoEI R protein C-terminal
MTEFKQIIGRGTRINEDYGKFWFTIMDFKKATELFADSSFNGEPVMIYEPKGDEPPVPPDDEPEIIVDENGNPVAPEGGNGEDGDPSIVDFGDIEPGTRRVKYVLGDVTVYVVAERVQYYEPEGTLIIESLKDYTRQTVRKDYSSLDAFLRRWTKAERKAAILHELEEHGVLLEPLAEEVGKDFDAFDLICHVAFDQPPLTRRERAENVKKRNYFAKYGDQRAYVIRSVFEDAYNYMKSGQLIRQVVNKIQEGVDFNKVQERHLFGDMYEQLLRDLQGAGNAGEFYTPRAVTEFMVRMVNPRLGEKVMDPACGTGGFLTCSIPGTDHAIAESWWPRRTGFAGWLPVWRRHQNQSAL